VFLPTNASMTHPVEQPEKEKNPDTIVHNRSNNFNGSNMYVHQPQWSRRLRPRSAAARLLGSWVPTPQGAWIFVVSILCFQVVGLITLPEEVRRFLLSTNLKNEEAMDRVGPQRQRGKRS